MEGVCKQKVRVKGTNLNIIEVRCGEGGFGSVGGKVG